MFGAIIGLVAIVIGFVYAVKIFGAVYSTLDSPEGFGKILDKWAEAVSGKARVKEVVGENVLTPKIIAIVVLGGGTLILVQIAMGFMVAGVKVLSYSLSDREAVKKILRHAFGSGRKAPPPPGTELAGDSYDKST